MSETSAQSAVADDGAGPIDVGTRVRRQAVLLKTETLQNAILNSANFAIIATDAKGTIQLFNIGAERILGYAASDVVNKITPSDIHDPQEVIARAEALSAEFATTITPGFDALAFKASRGIEDKYELTYIRKDGSRFPAQVSITTLRDDQSGIVGYLLIGTDISAQVAMMRASMREATAALTREVEERQRFFETSLDLILVVDSQGNFIRVSSSSMAILGYRPEELIGRSAAEFIYRYDLPHTRDEMRSARRGRLMRNFETRYVHKDGHVVTLAWAGVWSQSEEQHFFFGRNVTAEKAAEELFQLAVESCPTGMVMIDGAGRIVLVNGEIERLFGYQRDELIGQPVDMIVPVRLHAEHVRDRDKYIAPPKIRHMDAGGDLFGRRKDGSEFSVEVGLNPIHAGQDLLVLGVIVDISERKRIDLLKDEFVATVSHELRTPLTSIAGALGLLAGNAAGKLPDPAARLLSIAYSNTQRLVRLLDDILDIEKIESGKVVFDMKRVEVCPLVQQTIEANRAFAEGYDVRVRLDPASAAVDVRADPDRLVQVVTNLLSNAIKFSPSGDEVVVAVETQSETVRISVRDHGHGVPNEFKPRIFEKFAQADATDARQKGGTGLGLSIVKQIVARLDGKVGFEDAPGGGTIFYVELPNWARAVRTQSHLFRKSDLRVLLCEDNPEAAIVLCDRLREAGFVADVALTANDAVARVAAASYAAILVDLQLPEGDGISLIKQLRAQPQIYNTLLVVLSADSEQARDEKRSSTLLNILDWLDTPIDVARLVRVLDRPIARNGSMRPRILHMDSDQDVLRVVAKALRAKAEVMSVDSIDKARRALAANRFDVAVLDVALAVGSGFELLHELRDSEGDAIPLVVFSPQDANPAFAAQVRAALIKSRTSIDDLVATLRKRLAGGSPPVNEKDVA